MSSNPSQRMTVTPSQIVAAVFLRDMSARDAIADLTIAGFTAKDIGVALSEEGKRTKDQSSNAAHTPTSPVQEGKHSFYWKFRHSQEHDLHSQGPGLSSRPDAAIAGGENPPYTEIDLTDTLVGFGMPDDTIRLLDREVGAHGILLLVNAGSRVDEVESILEKNRGLLRTAMATEVPHTSRHRPTV
ncbi:MAG TPA: hypothetical protein VFE27_04055 [Acidobacteriaceae bacterium]|nr:hypothetical protein [Acidobacteriaceae bacterium]